MNDENFRSEVSGQAGLIPVVRTARLALVPLVAEDAGVLHCIYQQEGILQYFPNPTPPPLEKVQRFVSGQQTHWARYGYGNWGILPDGAGEIAGWGGCQYLDELDETEIGYLLARPFWGQGYATEVARASLRFGFERSGLDHLIALVHPENGASRRVIEKCGLVYQNRLSLWGIELLRYRLDRQFCIA